MSQQIDEIDPKHLELDLENPRFGLTDANGEPEALRILATRADLKELWDSINQRGFERFEPLVAFKRGASYIVVEGNRRLAAVKTMLAPDLLGELRMAPPPLSKRALDTTKTLPVIVVARREDADDYIGFKHINGPATWGALAKAKFAVKLFSATKVEQGQTDTRIQALSKRLGDSRQLILRSLIAYKIFEQAKSNGMLTAELAADNSLDFSHLYTIIQSPAARAYLGLTDAPLHEGLIVDNPIPTSHLDKLRYMMTWLFGSEKQSAVIKSQGTDRPKLTKILASPNATETLESTGEFEQAAIEAGFKTDSWLSSVVQLATLTKTLSNGISELPSDMDRGAITKAQDRLAASMRAIQAAQSQLSSLFP